MCLNHKSSDLYLEEKFAEYELNKMNHVQHISQHICCILWRVTVGSYCMC